MQKFLIIVFLFVNLSLSISAQSFKITDGQFILNNKPFRIYSGEMHYARVPKEYWRDRLLKIKATGLNTVCTYVFWNFHEHGVGKWDFSGRKNIAEFIRIAQAVGLNVILRPGPYVCGEWDFGGLPARLLNKPNANIRCNNADFMMETKRYINRLAKELIPLQITHGGPIIMLQLENEYGAYGNDKSYLSALKKILVDAGFNVPLYSGDNPFKVRLDAAVLKDVMPVINFGAVYNMKAQDAFSILPKYRNNIPQMCGEYWTGWFTAWGQNQLADPIFSKQKEDIQWMLENNKSFNLYMIHGGTNFGFTAGANNENVYEPLITSYDYASPINEMGQPTAKAYELREMLQKYTASPLPAYPKPLPVIEIPEIKIDSVAVLWQNLPKAIPSVLPRPMEFYNQDCGYILYRTKLQGSRYGLMKVRELHDYATIFLNGMYLGILNRMKNIDTINIPKLDECSVILDILVEAMGRNNFGFKMAYDSKGISNNVSFGQFTQMNWEVFTLPMDSKYINKLNFIHSDSSSQKGTFFKGTFELEETGDTYLDLSKYKKGFVFVNGNNLGRFWDIGPQKRLYCPAPWLKKGKNEIIIFDMLQTQSATVKGVKSLE